MENDKKALEELVALVKRCGGKRRMVSSFTTRVHIRQHERRGDRRYLDADGRQYSSRPAVVRALGLRLPTAKKESAVSLAREKKKKPRKKESHIRKKTLKSTKFVFEFNAISSAQKRGKKRKAPSFLETAEALQVKKETEFNPGSVLDTEWNKRKRPDPWRPISENVYVYPATKETNIPPYEWQQCDCEATRSGCGEECVNRRLQMECAIGFCRGGHLLPSATSSSHTIEKNDLQSPLFLDTLQKKQRLRRSCSSSAVVLQSQLPTSPSHKILKKKQIPERYACANTVLQCRRYPSCEIFETIDHRGFGLRCMIDTPCGTPIGEYRGEVITADEFDKRRKRRPPDAAFYVAALGDGLFIDAETKGAYARFANHSCNPNCELQKWSLGRELKLLLVTTRDVTAGTELTYNYNAGGGVADVTDQQACHCGAQNCSGKIGGKVVQAPKPVLLRKKKRKKKKNTKPPPPPKPVDGQPAKHWALTALKTLTQNSKYPVPIENAPLELCVRLESAAERSKSRYSTRRAKHCFCRLPESILLPTPLRGTSNTKGKKKAPAAVHQTIDTLICCDRCSKWYHPTCVFLETLPTDTFLCPLCDPDFEILRSLALSTKRAQPRVWRRTLRASATLNDALKTIADAPKSDCLRDARLALEFLQSIVDDTTSWATRAQQLLENAFPPAINAACLRPFVEIICQGHMLEFTHRDHAKLMARAGLILDKAIDLLVLPKMDSDIMPSHLMITTTAQVSRQILPPVGVAESIEVVSESSSDMICSSTHFF